jgi:hypothetical protein
MIAFTEIEGRSTEEIENLLEELMRIKNAARDMAKAIIAYDRKHGTHIQDDLPVKTRQCIKKDIR